VFDGKIGKQFGTMSFAKFVGDPHAANDQFGEDTFLNWAKNNKRSWKHDRFRVRPLLRAFGRQDLGRDHARCNREIQERKIAHGDKAQNETKSCIRQT